MNKFDHIKDLNGSLEDLNRMQDHILDNYHSEKVNKKETKKRSN